MKRIETIYAPNAKTMFKFLLLFCFSITAYVAGAQNAALLRGANTAFESGDYYNAALRYEEYLGLRKGTAKGFAPYSPQLLFRKGKENEQKVVLQLAEAYRRLPDYGAAEKYYAIALSYNTQPGPAQAWVAYAASLRANGKGQDLGIITLQELLKRTDLTADQRGAAEREMQTIRFGEAVMKAPEAKLFTITEKASVNSGTGDYAAIQKDAALYFTSTRREDTNKTAHNALYRAGNGGAELLTLPATAMHKGTPAFSADGNTLYFTAWDGKGGRPVAAIYQVTHFSEAWSAPVKLAATVNAEGSNSRQPWVVMVNGKQRLYFSSDRPGGQGGYDIWYTDLSADGQPGMAVNAGTTINTTGDEGSPFYHQSTGTLVFSSNGHPGMGGFDLFAVKGAEAAVNMGYPVNSVRDDLYFFSSGDSLYSNALLSSDRLSDCCLQIFAISKAEPKVGQRLITGILTDCATGAPIASGAVQVGSQQITTDAKGQYRLMLAPAAQWSIRAAKQGYPAKDTFLTNSTDQTVDKEWVMNLCLESPVAPASVAPPIVLFDFDQAVLSADARRQLDSVAAALQADPAATVSITGYTDAKGGERYNSRLAARRARACQAYLLKKGIAPSRLKASAKGACCPVAPDSVNGADNPEGRRLNRRVEIQLQ